MTTKKKNKENQEDPQEEIKEIALEYTGGGFGGSWQGIPARDLTPEEVEQHGGFEKLLETGLYALPNEEQTSEEVN